MYKLHAAEGFGQFMNGIFTDNSPMIEDIISMSEYSEQFITKPKLERDDFCLREDDYEVFDIDLFNSNKKDV